MTPGETADMLTAHKERENRIALREAWKLSLQIGDKVEGKDRDKVSPLSLFRDMPGAFPSDMPGIKKAIEDQSNLTPRQRAERERRRNLKRVVRPQ